MKHQIRFLLPLVGVAFAIAAVTSPVSADDITDEIEAALLFYQDGDISQAKEALDFASQLLAQKKAESLGSYLPEPLDGWSIVDTDTSAAGAAMFGGGVTATQTYSNGSTDCTVTLVGDSPMLQMMAMMFSNPSAVGASGGRMQRVGRQKAIITAEGEVQLMVNNFFITINGGASEEDKIAYAGGVDYAGLADF